MHGTVHKPRDFFLLIGQCSYHVLSREYLAPSYTNGDHDKEKETLLCSVCEKGPSNDIA